MDEELEVKTSLHTLLLLGSIEEKLRAQIFKTEKARDRQSLKILATLGRIAWELRWVEELQRKWDRGF